MNATMSDIATESYARRRSEPLDLHALREVPQRPRRFKIRSADSDAERQSASYLVDRMYATRGYRTNASPMPAAPSMRTFLASDQFVAVGTLTIGLDTPQGLMADQLFPEDVQRLRETGGGVCEFTKLAMDRRARSPRLLASLFHIAYVFAYRLRGVRYLLIEVNPRHVRYYQCMLGFEVVGEPRHNTRVNAPAVLLSLDLAAAERQIALFGGKSHHAVTERSAYPYFFAPADEAGILSRMEGKGQDIAQVFDYESVLNPLPLQDEPRH
jgi:hypothetical protein